MNSVSPKEEDKNLFSLIVKYISFVDKNIQKMLPTPPIKIAAATPIILPVPKVPARTVINDLKELIPSDVFFLLL